MKLVVIGVVIAIALVSGAALVDRAPRPTLTVADLAFLDQKISARDLNIAAVRRLGLCERPEVVWERVAADPSSEALYAQACGWFFCVVDSRKQCAVYFWPDTGVRWTPPETQTTTDGDPRSIGSPMFLRSSGFVSADWMNALVEALDCPIGPFTDGATFTEGDAAELLRCARRPVITGGPKL